jgi:adenine/guanine phosphoribosyltransferase-like PRPP-binding protein
MKNWERTIREETEKCKVTTLGDKGKKYLYGILPLESRFDPRYLDAVTRGLTLMLNDELARANVIVGIEAKGFVITPLLANQCKKDWVAIRKRDYKTSNQVVFIHKTPYGKKEKLFCVGLKKGDKVLLVDDIISGGGTITSVVNGLKNNYELVGVGTLYDRGNGRKIIKKETGISPKSLATIDVANGKVKVLRFYPENNL